MLTLQIQKTDIYPDTYHVCTLCLCYLFNIIYILLVESVDSASGTQMIIIIPTFIGMLSMMCRSPSLLALK